MAIGVADKAVLTKRFLQRKMSEYRKLLEEIETLRFEAEQANHLLQTKENHQHEP